MSKKHNVLEIVNLHKSFGGIKAVKNCDFTVEKGSITGLIGPNGAGKTTVFNLITGFIKADKGKILLHDKNIVGVKPYKIARMGLSRTFQMIRLFPKMTVLENVMLASKGLDESIWEALLRLPFMKQKEKEIEEKAMGLLKFVGLERFRNKLAGKLSFGQQKLLEIARSLASEPELLLLDEPASGVNLTMLNTIKHLLLELQKRGKTILLVEHNIEFVMDMCNKVVVLDHGEEIAVGKPSAIQKNKKVLDAYLGDVDKKLVT
jgi:branched-chain amino acid transport system ATP-binding protein